MNAEDKIATRSPDNMAAFVPKVSTSIDPRKIIAAKIQAGGFCKNTILST
jgi:hypothetical protein